MGPRTLKACQEHTAVYLHAIGGAGSLIAASVEEVIDVYKKDEFGTPEAFWKIRVKDFPAVVTMDSLDRERNGLFAGLTVLDMVRGRLLLVRGKALIIATGGAGQIFGFTTSSETVTGDAGLARSLSSLS